MANDRNFYPLEVKSINEETHNTSSISFKLSDEQKEKFRFIQGQYLTFKIEIKGTEHRRSYSICSSMQESDLRVAVKQLDNGTISKYLNEDLKEGDVLQTMIPQGNFHTELDPENEKNYVAYAAGSGITPVMSIIKTTLNTENKSNFLLHYGNQYSKDIIFKKELSELEEKYQGRFKVKHYLSQDGSEGDFISGRIEPDTILKPSKLGFEWDKADDYFLCGPSGMIDNVKAHLLDEGVDKNHIHYELFTSSDTDLQESKETETAISNSDFTSSNVEIILDEESTTFNLDPNGRTVLEAAIEAGIDPPYSCRGGVCTTCMARLKSGKVKMDMNHALTDSELEDGYILTCQSHPTTEGVKISYDDI